MPFVWAAAIGAGASLLGGVMSSGAASDAASTQAASADRAAELQQKQYETTRNDLMPYNAGGQAANNRLMGIFGLGGGGVGAPAGQPQQPAGVSGASMLGAPAQPQQGNGKPGSVLPPGWKVQSGEGGATWLIDDKDQIRTTLDPALDPAWAVNDYLTSAGIPVPETGQPAPQQAQTFAPQQPNALFSAGAMPGAGSAVTPYAAPNNGVFAPEGGAVYQPPGGTEFKMTPEELAQTPGYQFTLDQGNRAINNSAAARGGVLSGGAVKAGMRFAAGLADNTYMNQAQVFGENYNRGSTLFGDNYNRQNNLFGTNLNSSISLNDQYYGKNISPLFDIAKMGANAAAQTGQIGANSADSQAKLINTSGVAQGQAQLYGANALNSGFNQAGNNILYSAGRAGWLTPTPTTTGDFFEQPNYSSGAWGQ